MQYRKVLGSLHSAKNIIEIMIKYRWGRMACVVPLFRGDLNHWYVEFACNVENIAAFSNCL